MGNASCAIRRLLLLHLSQLEKCGAIGQVSCTDACQAYRPVTTQAEPWQQEPLFLSAFRSTRITPGHGSIKNTAQISNPTFDFLDEEHVMLLKVLDF